MRIAPVAAFVLAACFVAGCSLAQLTQAISEDKKEAEPAADAGGEAAAADAPTVKGAGCGIEGLSGTALCRATSLCPTIVVDSQAFPHCGFRIKGSSSELVCACGDSICSMGAFTTCAQAGQLLSAQTEGSVCVQVTEGRCTSALPAAPGSSGASGSGSSGAPPTCDRQCLQECGGGGGCASICGC